METLNILPWEAAQYVSSGLALLAVIVFAATSIAKMKFDRDNKLIGKANPDTLKDLLIILEGTYHEIPDLSGKDGKQKAELYKLYLNEKSRQKGRLRNMVLVFGFGFIVLALFAINKGGNGVEQVIDKRKDIPKDITTAKSDTIKEHSEPLPGSTYNATVSGNGHTVVQGEGNVVNGDTVK